MGRSLRRIVEGKRPLTGGTRTMAGGYDHLLILCHILCHRIAKYLI